MHVSSEDGTDEINTKECNKGKSEGNPTGRRVPTGIPQGGVAEERECGGGAGGDPLEGGIRTERNSFGLNRDGLNAREPGNSRSMARMAKSVGLTRRVCADGWEV